MAITIIGGDNGIERRELPANKDRAGSESIIQSNGLASAPDFGPSSESTPEDEALQIGIYPYSGADIKLVVHLPPEDPRVSARTEQEVNDELRQAIADRERASDNEESVSQAESALIALREEEQQQITLAQITTEGTLERTEAEADVTATREEIATMTTFLQEARSGVGSISELDSRISDLSDQLKSLQDGTASPPTSRTKVLAEIQTLSVSSHREKYPVRTLGSVYMRSVTRGIRTVSGSAVFTTFHNHVMREFLETAEYRSTGVGDWDRFGNSSYLMDQIPPLDISISFANEYGNLSWMAILGVEFINEGMVMSIEDLFLEGTTQYIARDFDPIRSVAHRRMGPNRGIGQSLHGTSIMAEHFRRRQRNRNLPWS